MKKLSIGTLLLIIFLSALSLPSKTTAGGTATPTSMPIASKDTGTLDNPVPLGQTYRLLQSTDRYFTLGIIEVIRGNQALKAIQKANPYSDINPDLEYILIHIQVKYTDGPKASWLSLDRSMFKIITGGALYKLTNTLTVPYREFNYKILPGVTKDGWIIACIDPGDPNPLLWVPFKSDDSEGLAFSLTSQLAIKSTEAATEAATTTN